MNEKELKDLLMDFAIKAHLLPAWSKEFEEKIQPDIDELIKAINQYKQKE